MLCYGQMDGYFPADGAAFQGRPQIMRMLLDRGVSCFHTHKDGHTPLHRATWGGSKGHLEVIKMLLEAGAVPKFEATEEDNEEAQAHIKLEEIKDTFPDAHKVLLEWRHKQEAEEAEEASAATNTHEEL